MKQAMENLGLNWIKVGELVGIQQFKLDIFQSRNWQWIQV